MLTCVAFLFESPNSVILVSQQKKSLCENFSILSKKKNLENVETTLLLAHFKQTFLIQWKAVAIRETILPIVRVECEGDICCGHEYSNFFGE